MFEHRRVEGLTTSQQRNTAAGSRRGVSLLVACTLGLVLLLPGAPASADDYTTAIDLTFPVAGPTSYIDDYHYCRGTACERRHRATDIMAPYGALVHAAMGGSIAFITGLDGNPPHYGYMISIAGDDSRRYNYIHLGRQDLGPEEAYMPGLKAGTRVERGQPIGINGCSGNASCSAPHLHFEVVDPAVDDPYGTHRMNPYLSLRAAELRGDVPGVGYPHHGFSDVPAGSWYDIPVRYLKAESITEGMGGPGLFSPGRHVTRAQMAAFLWRAAGEPTGYPDHGFSDVPSGSWYDLPVRYLKAEGITQGKGGPGSFSPDAPITRAEMAAFLWRAAGEPTGYPDPGFSDVPSGSWYDVPVRYLKAEGITQGKGGPGLYSPRSSVTRAEMAAFLWRSAGRPLG